MKTLTRSLLMLLCFFTLSATAHPIILNAGETFTYQFSELPFLRIQTYYSGTAKPEGHLFWEATSFESGTQLEVKLFEDSANDEPLYQDIWLSPGLSGGMTLYPPGFLNVWQDLQGAFSMTVLSGSASINKFEISSFVPIDATHANFYYQTVPSVPEPKSAALFVIAAMGLLLNQIIQKSRSIAGLRLS